RRIRPACSLYRRIFRREQDPRSECETRGRISRRDDEMAKQLDMLTVRKYVSRPIKLQTFVTFYSTYERFIPCSHQGDISAVWTISYHRKRLLACRKT